MGTIIFGIAVLALVVTALSEFIRSQNKLKNKSAFAKKNKRS